MPADKSIANAQSFYSDHHRWLLAMLWRKLGNRFDAADITQDTFERAFRRNRYQQLDEPRAYLTTIATRLATNHRRRQEIERACLETLAVISSGHGVSLEQRHILKQVLCELDELLHRLNPKARQAFLLYQFDGLNYAQIAAELRVSERMVKKYMAQAMLHCLQSSFWEDVQSAIAGV